MKLFETLNDESFILYAMQNYYNPACIDAEEFYQDLKRFKYLKRLLSRYADTGELATNLILNHLIIILNVFGHEGGFRMIEYKLITDKNISILKPFLIYLKAIPNDRYTNIEMNKTAVESLRKI